MPNNTKNINAKIHSNDKTTACNKTFIQVIMLGGSNHNPIHNPIHNLRHSAQAIHIEQNKSPYTQHKSNQFEFFTLPGSYSLPSGYPYRVCLPLGNHNPGGIATTSLSGRFEI